MNTHFPAFFAAAPHITLHDPLAEFLGSCTDGLIEYRYANFDVTAAQADYDAVTEAINDLQLKIDLCNQTVTFEIDL